MHRFLVTALLLLAFPTNAGAGSFADFNKGIAAHNRGEIDLSISAFSDALAAGDLSADTQSVAHLDRGNAYAHKKQWLEAIADFDAVLKLKPNNREAHSARAAANIALGNSDAAKRDLLAAAEIVPNDYSFWFALGRFEWQTQDYETALPHLERAVFLDPKNTYAVLWAEIARQSVHRPDTDRLAKQAVLTDLDFWPGPIAEQASMSSSAKPPTARGRFRAGRYARPISMSAPGKPCRVGWRRHCPFLKMPSPNVPKPLSNTRRLLRC